MLDYALIFTLNARPKVVDLDEVAHLRQVRNSVAYGGRRNSLVEWMLSEEWTTVTPNETPTSISGEIDG